MTRSASRMRKVRWAVPFGTSSAMLPSARDKME